MRTCTKFEETQLIDFRSKRMLSELEARAYTGLGRTSVRKLGEQLNCIYRFGRRILYDRVLIDAYFDEQNK